MYGARCSTSTPAHQHTSTCTICVLRFLPRLRLRYSFPHQTDPGWLTRLAKVCSCGPHRFFITCVDKRSNFDAFQSCLPPVLSGPPCSRVHSSLAKILCWFVCLLACVLFRVLRPGRLPVDPVFFSFVADLNTRHDFVFVCSRCCPPHIARLTVPCSLSFNMKWHVGEARRHIIHSILCLIREGKKERKKKRLGRRIIHTPV